MLQSDALDSQTGHIFTLCHICFSKIVKHLAFIFKCDTGRIWCLLERFDINGVIQYNSM